MIDGGTHWLAALAALALLLHPVAIHARINATAKPTAVRDPQLWPSGEPLRICIVPPTVPSAAAAATAWNQSAERSIAAWQSVGANLTLKLESCGRGCEAESCTDPCKQPQQIRIGYVSDGSSRTLRGRQAMEAGNDLKGCPTMRMSFNQLKKVGTDAERLGLFIHEFGHALGLMHEHQRARCPVDNRVQRAYAGLPIDSTQSIAPNIAQNFVDADYPVLPGMAFQSESVMTYPVPPSLSNELATDPALTACLAPATVTSLSDHDGHVLRAAYSPSLAATRGRVPLAK